jgi:hypothetical protein
LLKTGTELLLDSMTSRHSLLPCSFTSRPLFRLTSHIYNMVTQINVSNRC